MPVFNENGATVVPSATAEFAFMETGDNALKNCTPAQLAEAQGLTTGTVELNVADIITTGPYVDVRAFLPDGYVTDGSVDYLTEIAAAFTAASGKPVVFERGVTYGLGLAGLSIPAGSKVQTNGCTFSPVATQTGNTSLIRIFSNTIIDELNVSVPTGLRLDRPVAVIGDDINFGNIKITSVDVQLTSETNDGGLKIAVSDRIKIGMIEVTNFDKAINLNDTDNITIEGCLITSYVRGFWANDCRNLKVGKSHIKTRSPNATITSGHNGLLIDALSLNSTRNCTFEDWTVENAGEHGIRIGGDKTVSNVSLVRPHIKGSGASGIKILGDSTANFASPNFHRRITIDNPILEDSGELLGGETELNENRSGIHMTFCVESKIIHPIIRKESNNFSGRYGIVIRKSSDIDIDNPQVFDSESHGIFIDGVYGDNDRIRGTGGSVLRAGGNGLRINYDIGTHRRINFNRLLLEGNTGTGTVVSQNSGSGALSFVVLDLVFNNNTGGSIACDSTGVQFFNKGALNGVVIGTVLAANSSMWNDLTNTYIMKAGTWTAL